MPIDRATDARVGQGSYGPRAMDLVEVVTSGHQPAERGHAVVASATLGGCTAAPGRTRRERVGPPSIG